MKRRDVLKVAGVGYASSGIVSAKRTKNGGSTYVATLRSDSTGDIDSDDIISARVNKLRKYVERNGEQEFVLHEPNIDHDQTVYAYNLVIDENGGVKEQLFSKNEMRLDTDTTITENISDTSSMVKERMHNNADSKLEEAIQESETSSTSQTSDSNSYDWEDWAEIHDFEHLQEYHGSELGIAELHLQFSAIQHPDHDDKIAVKSYVHNEPGHSRCHIPPNHHDEYCAPFPRSEFLNRKTEIIHDWYSAPQPTGWEDDWPESDISNGSGSEEVSLGFDLSGSGVSGSVGYSTTYSTDEATLSKSTDKGENTSTWVLEVNEPNAISAEQAVEVEPGSIYDVTFNCDAPLMNVDIKTHLDKKALIGFNSWAVDQPTITIEESETIKKDCLFPSN